MLKVSPSRGWVRAGCQGTLVLLGVGLLVAIALYLVVAGQVRSNRPELHSTEHDTRAQTSDPLAASEASSSPIGRLELDIDVVQLIVKPVADGDPLRVHAYYDESRYEFEESRDLVADGSWAHRISLRPKSMVMAMLRAKLGNHIALLRIELPRGTPMELTGNIRGSIASMELGGLNLRKVQFEVRGGAATVSFIDSLEAPMEEFVLIGNTGSIHVTGLGNASPGTVLLQQHLGVMNLDLRGDWRIPAEVDIRVGVAGGTLWLPEGARVTGVEGRLPLRAPGFANPEIPPIDVWVDVLERGGGRMLLID